jgi:hypothetical protein
MILNRLALLLLLTALIPFAACGDDDDEEGGGGEPKTVAIKLTQSGKKLRFTVPKSVEGGVVRIEFTNSSKAEHEAQLARIEGDHTVQEGLQAGGAWAEGKGQLPPWLSLAGGVGGTPAGETRSATQELPPGRYVVIETEQNTNATFEVEGEGDAELAAPAGRIDAVEYAFRPKGVKAGRSEILFANKGSEPHFIDGVSIKPGKTIEDVREYTRTEKGEDPLNERGTSFVTTIADGGVSQVIQADLEPGRYALLCFVPDRKGGPPHVAKGMISELVVEE